MPKRSTIELFHGSEKIVQHPSLVHARPHNDYGPGFYCTLDVEMAKEWACKRNADGYANRYQLNTSKLKVLDLMSGEYTVLHWIALLLRNREFDLAGSAAPATRSKLLQLYSIDLSPYDVVVGYRADDSYFQYAQQFVENALNLEDLSKALVLGNLGEQTVLVSQKAFRHLEFVDAAPADKEIYYPRFIQRDTAARMDYKVLVQRSDAGIQGTFAVDIVREGGAENASIPRMLRG